MQNIMNELLNGTLETVKVHEDGSCDVIRRPPTALMLRARQLIIQVIEERDGMNRAALHQQQIIADKDKEIERLNQQLKELNEAQNVSMEHLSRPEPGKVTEDNQEGDSRGKNEASRG